MSKQDEFFDELAGELAEEAKDFSSTSVPSNAGMVELSQLGEKYWKLEERKKQLEVELESVKGDINRVSRQDLPSLMATLGVDSLGLPFANADIVVKPYFHANISQDWDEERREDAFNYLDELGAGGLVKTVLSLSFGRNELDRAKAVVALVRQAISYLSDAGVTELPDPEIAQTVPWNTLTSYVKSKIEVGDVIDLDKLGASTGVAATIKLRKESKK